MGRSDYRLKKLIQTLGSDYQNFIYYSVLTGSRQFVGNYKQQLSMSVNDMGISSLHVDNKFFDNSEELQQSLLVREVLRLLLEHPLRSQDDMDKDIWKLASDLTLNNYLHRYLGFEIDTEPTLFEIGYTGRPVVEDVYKFLKKLQDESPKSKKKKQKGEGGGGKSDQKSDGDDEPEDDDESEDESEGGGSGDKNNDEKDGDGDSDKDENEEPQDAPSDVSRQGLQKLVENTAKSTPETPEIAEIASQSQQPGTEPGTLMRTFDAKRVRPKPKWDQVIKKWTRKGIKENLEEQWVNNPMNLDSFLRSHNSRLPGDRLVEKSVAKAKVPVACYADVSGSCTSYFERFMKAAVSIPLDKFIVELRAFDTRVYKVRRKQIEIPGGGGTSITPVVADYNKIKNEMGRDVHCFVITDGYFSVPTIDEKERPRWHWFITEGGTRANIPPGCHIYELSDFE